MGFVFKLHGNIYAVNGRTSGVLPSSVAKLNWVIPTPWTKIEFPIGHFMLPLLMLKFKNFKSLQISF